MEHNTILIYMVQNIYAKREKDVLFLNALRNSLAPTPRKEPFHVMFVETNHTQEQKETKVVGLESLVVERSCSS